MKEEKEIKEEVNNMDEIKVISTNENEITLQRTYTIKVNNEHDLIRCWYDDVIDASELEIIKETLFPELTDDQFNEIAEQIDNEEEFI